MKFSLPFRKPSPILTFVLIVLGLVVILALIILYSWRNPNQESKQILARVGRLMELPKDEKPTIATVTDKTKLDNQSFFKSAENGDKVLLYPQARKAILYRPSINKIIEVAPISLQTSATPTPMASPVKVALYNGTATPGLTKQAEKELKEKLTNIEIILKKNAGSTAYSRSLITNLSNIDQNFVAGLAKLLGADIASLPQGETRPGNADLLVILGNNFNR